MRQILVDSSVWISYFRSSSTHASLDELIREGQICTNDLILAELVPTLKVKKQAALIEALLEIPRRKLATNWELIINYQIRNLKAGINKVGIPDLIILDHVIQNNLILYSEDGHFRQMAKVIHFELYKYQ